MTARLILRELAEALFPQRCVACHHFGAALHDECVATLTRAELPRCDRCWRPGSTPCARCLAEPRAFEAIRTPFVFDGAVRRGLLEAKFQGHTAILSPLAVVAAGMVPASWEVTAVVPVPLHRRRWRQRGYNQAEIIASTLARTLTLPLQPAWLSRTRHTPSQVGLNAEERAANLTRAFTAGPIPPSMRILLVDDVTTTGATFDACARTLAEAGAESVFGIAIARED